MLETLRRKFLWFKKKFFESNLCIAILSKKGFFGLKKFLDCFFSLNLSNECVRSRISICVMWFTEILSLFKVIKWNKLFLKFLPALRKQFLWIKETFLWHTVKEKIPLNWRKFFYFNKIFFNINKSISLGQRQFFWINKTSFNSKKFFHWHTVKEMFLWLKEKVISRNQINLYLF